MMKTGILKWCTGLDVIKTRIYNFDSLKSNFYIVKLEFTGVYIIFLISAKKKKQQLKTKNVDCGCALEPPRQGGSNEYP